MEIRNCKGTWSSAVVLCDYKTVMMMMMMMMVVVTIFVTLCYISIVVSAWHCWFDHWEWLLACKKSYCIIFLRVFIGRCGNAFGSIGAESVCYICRHLVISHIATIVQVYHACGQNFAHFCFCLIFRRNSRQASALTRERGTHHPR